MHPWQSKYNSNPVLYTVYHLIFLIRYFATASSMYTFDILHPGGNNGKLPAQQGEDLPVFRYRGQGEESEAPSPSPFMSLVFIPFHFS